MPGIIRSAMGIPATAAAQPMAARPAAPAAAARPALPTRAAPALPTQAKATLPAQAGGVSKPALPARAAPRAQIASGRMAQRPVTDQGAFNRGYNRVRGAR